MNKLVRLFHENRLKCLYFRLARVIIDNILFADDYDQVRCSFDVADKLIENGDLQMSFFLGLAYLDEGKNWYNPAKAKRYIEMSANGGVVEAQCHLGMIYYLGLTGEGIDPVSGGYWIREAAKNGDKLAIRFLIRQTDGFSAIENNN